MEDPISPTELPEESAGQELPAEMSPEVSVEAQTESAVNEEPIHPAGSGLLRVARLVLPIILAAALGLGAGYFLWGRPRPADSPSAPVDLASMLPSSDPSVGPADAPITIVEFSDYECPYCRQWQSSVYAELLKAYPNRIRFVYRDFPLLGIHPEAEPAAEAANCAGDQGKYWEYHDRLLDTEPLGEKTYLTIAGQLDLDTARFTKCMQSQQFRAEVMADFKDGVTLGINGTPTFFVNGYRLEGAQPLADFKKFVDQVINQPVMPGP